MLSRRYLLCVWDDGHFTQMTRYRTRFGAVIARWRARRADDKLVRRAPFLKGRKRYEILQRQD